VSCGLEINSIWLTAFRTFDLRLVINRTIKNGHHLNLIHVVIKIYVFDKICMFASQG
jgi:hypothetical protein